MGIRTKKGFAGSVTNQWGEGKNVKRIMMNDEKMRSWKDL
jgi:hypothetical protein